MVFTKVPFQIEMIRDCELDLNKITAVVRFFELQNGFITTTDKTEIEIDAEVSVQMIIIMQYYEKNDVMYNYFSQLYYTI